MATVNTLLLLYAGDAVAGGALWLEHRVCASVVGMLITVVNFAFASVGEKLRFQTRLWNRFNFRNLRC